MIDWIALNMTPGVGPRAATKLLERFGSADAVFHARRSELESLRLKPETTESIIKREFHGKAEKELGGVKELGGDVLILDDGSYPALLREIDAPGKRPRIMVVCGPRGAPAAYKTILPRFTDTRQYFEDYVIDLLT